MSSFASSIPEVPPPPALYFEKQELMKCLQHSLNNMLGSSVFSVSELNSASSLVQSNEPPVESSTGSSLFSRLFAQLYTPSAIALVGAWDVNTLIVACDRRGIDVRWSSASGLILDVRAQDFVGIVLNEPSKGLWGRVAASRHWTSCRKVAGEWYYFDSNLNGPTRIAAGSGDKQDEEPEDKDDAATLALLRFVKDLVADRNVHVFVATRRDDM